MYSNETYGNSSYGISSQAVSSFNVFIAIPANNLTTIDASASTNATLEIMSNANVEGFITIVQYNSLPPGIGSVPTGSLNKFVDIVTAASISSALNYSTISLKYSDAEVSAANLQESAMRLYRWNGSSWKLFDGGGNGINTSGNYAFANTSSFSVWGIFGTKASQDSSLSSSQASGGGTSGGGGGGGSIYSWQCTEWSECAPSGAQTRSCSLIAGQGLPTKPEETRACAHIIPENKTESSKIVQPEQAAERLLSQRASKSAEKPLAASSIAPTGFAVLAGESAPNLINSNNIAVTLVYILMLTALYAGWSHLYKKK